MENNKSLATGMLLSMLIVASVALIAASARADGPPKEVLENLKIMKSNQKILAETREAHEQFLEKKFENERYEMDNNARGWRTDWATMTPVPFH